VNLLQLFVANSSHGLLSHVKSTSSAMPHGQSMAEKVFTYIVGVGSAGVI
jgi:hypothetical protein